MSLPPGFRFHPTDVELVKYYLKRKILGKKLQFEAIAEINICKYAPWDLPDQSCLKNKDLEWYFFCPVERKYASGARLNRATEYGYWKSTGKDRPILYNDQTIGMVKTLVFHLGHAPKGERTDWVMHEFRILDKELADAGDVRATFVLCKVFKKSGLGPKNGAQYGAQFNDEEWDTDDDDVGTRAKSLLTSESLPQSAVAHNSSNSFVTRMFMESGTSTKSPILPEGLPLSAVAHDNSNSIVTSTFFQGSTSTESVPPPSKSLSAHHNCNSPNMLFQGSTSTGPLPELGPQKATALVDDAPPPAGEGADINSLLAMFREDYPPLVFDQNGFDQSGDAGYMELDDIFGGLENLDGWGGAEPTA